MSRAFTSRERHPATSTVFERPRDWEASLKIARVFGVPASLARIARQAAATTLTPDQIERLLDRIDASLSAAGMARPANRLHWLSAPTDLGRSTRRDALCSGDWGVLDHEAARAADPGY